MNEEKQKTPEQESPEATGTEPVEVGESTGTEPVAESVVEGEKASE